MKQRRSHILPGQLLFSIILIVSVFLISGCQTAGTPGQEQTPTPTTAPTPTPIPLGQAGNPVILAFVNENPGAPIKSEMIELADGIAAQTGLLVEANTFDSYDDLVTAMRENQAHVVWLQPATYIYLKQKNLTDVGLISNHYGLFFYGVQYLSNIESGYTLYYDSVTNQNAATADIALAQLDGARPCWINNESLSGYILPGSILKQNGFSYQTGVQIQSPTAAVRALYIKGICDFAATFAYSGDPRTSPSVLADLTDARERIVVIWQSDPIIPNLSVAFHTSMPSDVRSSLTTALTDIIQMPAGKAIISAALNYDVQDLRIVDDSIYDPIREALHEMNLPPDDMLGR